MKKRTAAMIFTMSMCVTAFIELAVIGSQHFTIVDLQKRAGFRDSIDSLNSMRWTETQKLIDSLVQETPIASGRGHAGFRPNP